MTFAIAVLLLVVAFCFVSLRALLAANVFALDLPPPDAPKTLSPSREHKNNRLWFKCNLKLGRLMYEVGDMARLQRIIKELLR